MPGSYLFVGQYWCRLLVNFCLLTLILSFLIIYKSDNSLSLLCNNISVAFLWISFLPAVGEHRGLLYGGKASPSRKKEDLFPVNLLSFFVLIIRAGVLPLRGKQVYNFPSTGGKLSIFYSRHRGVTSTGEGHHFFNLCRGRNFSSLLAQGSTSTGEKKGLSLLPAGICFMCGCVNALMRKYVDALMR